MMKIGTLSPNGNRWFLKTRNIIYSGAIGSNFLMDNDPLEILMSYRFPMGISRWDISSLDGMVAIAEKSWADEKWYVTKLEIDL